jgi:hypothetical protein
MTITIKTWEAGDWVEVWLGDELVTQNHSFDLNDLKHLLGKLGHEVVRVTVEEE